MNYTIVSRWTDGAGKRWFTVAHANGTTFHPLCHGGLT